MHFSTLTWMNWNAYVAGYSDKTYHIEDVGHLMEDLCVIMWPEYEEMHTRRRYATIYLLSSSSSRFDADFYSLMCFRPDAPMKGGCI